MTRVLSQGAPTYAVQVSNAEMNCQITFIAAELDASDAVISVVEAGTTLNVVEGFMNEWGTASVYIPCDSNGTGICYAEEGTVTLSEFTGTISEIEAGSLSGVRVAGTVDAKATRAGNEASAQYSFDVTLP